MNLSRFFVLSLLSIGFMGNVSGQESWSGFRGPDSGVVEGVVLPDAWSVTEHVKWCVAVPGRGWSSPVVWGDKIFVTTVVNEGKVEEAKKGLYFGGDRKKAPLSIHRWMVLCIDARTGHTLWEKVAKKGVPSHPLHIKNTYASETPLVDGKRVYAYFGNVGVFCYDMAGKALWEKPFKAHKTRYDWGTAASPVMDEDRIYIVNDNEQRSYLVAMDKKTGEQVWRIRRDEKSNWVTPFIWTHPLGKEIVTSGTGKVRSYSMEGKLLWELKGMSVIAIPTPHSAQGLLYVSSGYVMDKNRPVYAIRPGATGDITLKKGATSSEYVAWSLEQAGPYNPSPIVYGDYFYVLYDRGTLSCFDARTGKEIYKGKKLAKGANAFTASPWANNGKIFCLSEDGDTLVVKAGREFELLGTNKLNEMCMATPAAVDGDLLVRTLGKLYRIGK
ncbi:MAG: PQQ-binding-like beta-propeller repeat protein [Phycisphaerae bacterium]|nr:PQQ-binding-like beta-propeller repeat protein [Phycisphaerae bacterium]